MNLDQRFCCAPPPPGASAFPTGVGPGIPKSFPKEGDPVTKAAAPVATSSSRTCASTTPLCVSSQEVSGRGERRAFTNRWREMERGRKESGESIGSSGEWAGSGDEENRDFGRGFRGDLGVTRKLDNAPRLVASEVNHLHSWVQHSSRARRGRWRLGKERCDHPSKLSTPCELVVWIAPTCLDSAPLPKCFAGKLSSAQIRQSDFWR